MIAIYEGTAPFNPTAAPALLMKIDKRIDSIFTLPHRGAPRDDLSLGMRMLVEGKYLIFYRVNEGKVEILRVLHGAQDLAQQFN